MKPFGCMLPYSECNTLSGKAKKEEYNYSVQTYEGVISFFFFFLPKIVNKAVRHYWMVNSGCVQTNIDATKSNKMNQKVQE